MNEWSVLVVRQGDEPLLADEDGADKIDELSDLLLESGASVSFSKDRYSVRLAITSSNAVEALASAVHIVEMYAEKADLPGWPFVKTEATRWDVFERELEEPTYPNVVGVAELAGMLEVSKQRASELARSSRFPRPIAELASGPIWLEPTLRKFVSTWERRPGRPRL